MGRRKRRSEESEERHSILVTVWAVSQHNDTSKNTKAWAVLQHTDTSKNTKTWAVTMLTPARTLWPGMCHNALTLARTSRLGL